MKTKTSVSGFINRCPDYEMCPVCYGCRNFNPKYKKCLDECGTYKEDVCNTKKHRPDLITKLIRPNYFK